VGTGSLSHPGELSLPLCRFPGQSGAAGGLQHRVPAAAALGQPRGREQPGRALREVRQGPHRAVPQAGAGGALQRAVTPPRAGMGDPPPAPSLPPQQLWGKGWARCPAPGGGETAQKGAGARISD